MPAIAAVPEPAADVSVRPWSDPGVAWGTTTLGGIIIQKSRPVRAMMGNPMVTNTTQPDAGGCALPGRIRRGHRARHKGTTEWLAPFALIVVAHATVPFTPSK